MGLGQTDKQEFKMKSTCTTKKKRWLVQVEWKSCDGLSRGNFKHKFYTTHNLRKEAPLPSLIIYYVPLHGDYIQMSFFPETPKWESQNWDSYCSKTLDFHIFFKANRF
jgi:hypothetical protein